MSNFNELLISAQNGNKNAMEKIFTEYQAFLMKEALIYGIYDEDLYQELCIVLIQCVYNFRIRI